MLNTHAFDISYYMYFGGIKLTLLCFLAGALFNASRKYRSANALGYVFAIMILETIFSLLSHVQTNYAAFDILNRILAMPCYYYLTFSIAHFIAVFTDWKFWFKNYVRYPALAGAIVLTFITWFYPEYYMHSISANKFGFTSLKGSLFFAYLIYTVFLATANQIVLIRFIRRKDIKIAPALVLIGGGLLTIIISFFTNGVLPNLYPDAPSIGAYFLIIMPISGFIALRMNKNIFTLDLALVEIEVLRRAEDALVKANEMLESRVADRTAELQKTNTHLSEARKIADDANKAKSRFLSDMSHELRTPLTSIMGLAEICGAQTNPDSIRSFVTKIRNEAENLMHQINQVLDLSRIESGRFVLHNQEFSIHKLLSSMQNVFDIMAHNSKIDFTILLPPELPERCIGDNMRLRQVLVNLIGNAFKFTQEGSVTVSCSYISHTESEALFTFTITDTGTGISEENLSSIFDPYIQEHQKTAHALKGTGLGLAIARQFVLAMGGDISVTSKINKGSEFSFTIPFKIIPYPDEKSSAVSLPAPAQSEETAAKIKTLAHVHILIAEDHELNRELAVMLLENEGAEIETAENGSVAYDLFMKKQFDIILMDVRMPVMNGFEATRKIRTSAKGTRIPIIGLTGNAFESDKDEAMAAGMNDLLSKPYTVKQLLEKISQYIK